MLYLDWRFFPVFDQIDPTAAFSGVYEIAEIVELGSKIIDSEPGKGTIASVHLPEERLCRAERALAV